MELFFNNQDWPSNNIVQWKPREEGAKWRWIVKDTDFGLGLYGSQANYNNIKWFYTPGYDSGRDWGNTPEATLLFRRLMEIDQFKWEFLDKVAVYTGDFLSSDSVKALMDEMYNEVIYEYPNHRKLINEWWPNYDNEFNSAKTWMTNRAKYFFDHLKSQYSLSAVLTAKINNLLSVSEYNDIKLSVNDIPLSGGIFNGRLFNDRTLTIDGSCLDESKVIKGWTVVAKGKDNQTTTTNYEGSCFTYTPTNLSSVTFNAILGDAAGIDDILSGGSFNVYAQSGHLYVESDSSEDIIVYDINGRLIYRVSQTKNADTPIRRGVYIVKCGDKSKKIVVE